MYLKFINSNYSNEALIKKTVSHVSFEFLKLLHNYFSFDRILLQISRVQIRKSTDLVNFM